MIKVNNEIFKEFNDFNIKVADKLNKLLSRHTQFKIHQLEYDNNKVDTNLRERIDYINKNGTKKDLVISIHANYNNNPNIGGIDLFYASESGLRFLNILDKF